MPWLTAGDATTNSSTSKGRSGITAAKTSHEGSKWSGDNGSAHGSGTGSGGAARPGRGAAGYNSLREGSTAGDSGVDDDDLLAGKEPTFLGTMLAPRRSLRVINRD